MPLHTYQCNKCKTKFQKIVHFKELSTPCEKCGKRAYRILSGAPRFKFNKSFDFRTR